MYCFPEMLNMCKEIFAVTELRTFRHEPFCVCVCVWGGGGGGGGSGRSLRYVFICMCVYISVPPHPPNSPMTPMTNQEILYIQLNQEAGRSAKK